MKLSTAALLSGLVTAASAHFHLEYPYPRGAFNAANEINFCDSYTTPNATRVEFPLSGGFIALSAEHPKFALGVQLSTLANPTSFQNFTEATPFFQVVGEGDLCFPVNFAAAGIAGVENGANVTIQIVFDGGDGQLYQCADLTLSNTTTIASNIACSNSSGITVTPVSSSISVGQTTSQTATSTTPSATESQSSASANAVVGFSGLLGVVGTIFAML